MEFGSLVLAQLGTMARAAKANIAVFRFCVMFFYVGFPLRGQTALISFSGYGKWKMKTIWSCEIRGFDRRFIEKKPKVWCR
jgi:hypothetical protein